MGDIKIFTLDYLANNELTDNDLSNLLDNNKSLVYSIIIGMFNHINIHKSNNEIIKLITTQKRWMYKFFWSKEELMSFEDLLTKVLKNIYYTSEYIARQKAQWYITIYGFNRKGNMIDL